MKKVIFKIEGMHCSSCALLIDSDLEDLNGVKISNTNYAKQITQVEFDDQKVEEEGIIKTISQTGYRASIID